MKKIISLGSSIVLLFLIAIWGCKKDLNTTLNGQQIQNYDLVQLTDKSTTIPVTLDFSSNKSIDSVTITITPQSSTTSVSSNKITSVANSATSLIINMPFPSSTIAPSGVYTVTISMYSDGVKTVKSYLLNVLNNQTTSSTPCTFPIVPLTGSQNCVFYVTCPSSTNGDDVWISGDFETPNSWTGGGSQANYKLTKISNTCYYIAVKIPNGAQFKFTRGSWSSVEKASDGKDFPDGVSTTDNITWKGGNRIFDATKTSVNITISNWADKVLLPANNFPSSVIKSGYVTVALNMQKYIPSDNYYLVKRYGSLNDTTYKMVQVGTSSMLSVAIPQDTTSWFVLKNGNKNIGVNIYGIPKPINWDGISNPFYINDINNYLNDGNFTQLPPVPDSLYIVGDATADAWNNSNPALRSQTFKLKSPGVFELSSIALTGGKQYLFLPVAGDWTHKFGGLDKMGGTLYYDGSNNTPAPDNDGNYKIVVDFNKMIYTLTKQ